MYMHYHHKILKLVFYMTIKYLKSTCDTNINIIMPAARQTACSHLLAMANTVRIKNSEINTDLM